MYRGLVHFHSCYSYDSVSSIKSIVSFAVEKKINFLILTDHDKIEGANDLKRYISEKKLNIEVIVAAEYKTNLGDVIAVGISSQIINMNFESFVNEVREQGGLIFFPHPYVGHGNIDKIAATSDMIEVFNSRVSDDLNNKALDLAKRNNKPVYFASDAHSISELENSIIEFEKCGDVVYSMLNSKIKRATSTKTYNYQIVWSQIIKSLKRKSFKLLAINLIYSIKNYRKLLERA